MLPSVTLMIANNKTTAIIAATFMLAAIAAGISTTTAVMAEPSDATKEQIAAGINTGVQQQGDKIESDSEGNNVPGPHQDNYNRINDLADSMTSGGNHWDNDNN
jgi:hypothetical protein